MANFNSSGWFSSIPPVTKNLIIINIIVWLAEILVPGFSSTLLRFGGLHFYKAESFNPVQIVTYMFLHSPSSIAHILFNMFTLWMFGRVLEQVWGARRFLLFYFVCGIGAAVVQEAVWALTWQHDYIAGIAPLNGRTYDSMKQIVDMAAAQGNTYFKEGMNMYLNQMLTVGASGAIFGLLLGFAFVFPNIPMYLFFIPVPIKAKYMVAGYAVLEFFLGIGSSTSTVALFAHLGGLIFGLILLLIWKKKGTLRGPNF